MANLVVNHVGKVYRSADGPPLTILRDIDFSLSSGESLAILGPSGSGKSTLLSIIGTLDSPSDGQVLFDGVAPHQLDATALATFRRQHIGFIFQDHLLLPHLTALENVLVPALAMGPVTDICRQRASQLLDRVGLSQRQHHRPGAMSGGEQQRAALARALIHQPCLILADEPTGNLDRAHRDSVADLLRQMQLEHLAMLIIATHSHQLAERFDRQQNLIDGRLGQDGL